MTDTQDAIRPTQERVNHADHIGDDGRPTREQPYARPVRLGTPWDHYSRTKNRLGNPIPDSELTLTRSQIEAGNHYALSYEVALLGRVGVSKFEPSVDGVTFGLPKKAEEARRELWRAEACLTSFQPVMLQCVLFDGVTIEEWSARTKRLDKAPLWYLRDALDRLAVHYGYDKRLCTRTCKS